MDSTLLTLLTSLGYLLISGYQFWLLKTHAAGHIYRVALLSILPMATHAYLLHSQIDTISGQNLSMLNVFSMVFWIIAIALVLSSLLKRLQVLVMAVFPFSALVVALSGFSTNTHIMDASSSGYVVHINIAIAAISITGLAAIQSVFVTVLDNRLRNHPTRVNRALPALQDMEKFLYFLIALGFILLSLAIITAMLYMPGTGGKVPLHKPILSVASWLVFATFLVGRYRRGWRGKTAAHWTITGFALLFLAYFGTRTVLEFVLG